MNQTLPPTNADNKPTYSLSELSQALKKTVENAYDYVRVRAEVSQSTLASSGHLYFTLKDDTSTLNAICWKGNVANLTNYPEEGSEVIVTGKLTTYGARSQYQITVSDVELAGEGALLKQIEDRRRTLAEEGLFDAERKIPIPQMPRVIGIISSPTGAVIRDILHRFDARFPVHVLIWPVPVQGRGAGDEIAAAIKGFDALIDTPRVDIPCPDTLIVARGGGSIEDLMAFNDESVVRAVAACRLPIISGIGHETDTTLIDHVADSRAPTPTAAAEMATPKADDLTLDIKGLGERLSLALTRKVENAEGDLKNLAHALLEPSQLMENKGQKVNIATAELDRRIEAHLLGLNNTVRALGEQLVSPAQHITQMQSSIDIASEKITHRMMAMLLKATASLEHNERLLDSFSLNHVLERGFAVLRDSKGDIIRSANTHPDGAAIDISFADGKRDGMLKPIGDKAE